VSDADRCEPVAVQVIAQRVVCLVNEVVAGARPARLVTPLFTAHLRGVIRRARPDRAGVARIRHLLITSHSEGVYEVVAVCRRGDRTSAVGLQLTRRPDGRWQVTDVAHPQLRAGPERALSNPPSVQPPR
jgi:hypothetical protein